MGDRERPWCRRMDGCASPTRFAPDRLFPLSSYVQRLFFFCRLFCSAVSLQRLRLLRVARSSTLCSADSSTEQSPVPSASPPSTAGTGPGKQHLGDIQIA